MKKTVPETASGAGLIIALAILVGGTILAQCPIPEAPSDTSFVGQMRSPSLIPADSTAGVGTTYNMTRVVGPGTTGADGELNADGSLKNWGTDVANGVISEKAYINVVTWVLSGDPCAIGYTGCIPFPFAQGGIKLIVNGHQVTPKISSVNLLNKASTCLEFDSQYLRFPARAPAGSSPTSVENVIGFGFNAPEGCILLGWIPLGGYGVVPTCIYPYLGWDTYVVVGNLTIKAMAPIVLVHGWNSGPWVWGPKPGDRSACPVNPKDSTDGGQSLYNSLLNAKVPVDCSFNTNNRQSSIDDGAAKLQNQLQSILATFGTRHVNLVTHSKGGLFARKFLQLNADQDPTTRIGVISVTTLDAPHHGSVLSDTVVAYKYDHSVLPGIIRPFYPFLMRFSTQFKNSFGAGNNDMTVGYLDRVFNVENATPPASIKLQDTSSPPNTFSTKPFYYSTSGNADLNGDGILDDNEKVPYTASQVPGFRWQRLRSITAIPVHTDSSGRQIADPERASVFLDNDIAVTVQSAGFFPSFKEIGALRRNHATSKCGINWVDCAYVPSPVDIAPLLLQKVKDAELGQQPQ